MLLKRGVQECVTANNTWHTTTNVSNSVTTEWSCYLRSLLIDKRDWLMWLSFITHTTYCTFLSISESSHQLFNIKYMTQSISTVFCQNDEMLYKDLQNIFQWLTVTHLPPGPQPLSYTCPHANSLFLRSKANVQAKRLVLSDIQSLVEGQFALTIIHTSKPSCRQSVFNVALYNTVSLRRWHILVANFRWTSPNSHYHFYSLAVGRTFNVLPCSIQCITVP